MLLASAGYVVPTADITKAIYDQDKQATSSLDMLLYARSLGAHAVLEKASHTDLIKWLASDIPVLVALDEGQSNLVHFVVVYGTYGSDLVVHDGYVSDRIIPISTFLSQWEAAGNMALWIGAS